MIVNNILYDFKRSRAIIIIYTRITAWWTFTRQSQGVFRQEKNTLSHLHNCIITVM